MKYVLGLESVKSLIPSKLVVRRSTICNVYKTLASSDIWNGSFPPTTKENSLVEQYCLQMWGRIEFDGYQIVLDLDVEG